MEIMCVEVYVGKGANRERENFFPAGVGLVPCEGWTQTPTPIASALAKVGDAIREGKHVEIITYPKC